MSTSMTLRTGAVGLVVGLGVVLFPPGDGMERAEAQSMSVTQRIGSEGSSGAPVSSAHLTRYAEVLGLSADQLAAAELLLDGLIERHTLAQVEMNEKLGDLRAEAAESGDFRIFMEEMPAARARYSDERDAIERAFFDDLRLLLTSEQETRWDGVERTRRRLTTIGNGSLAGETVDLVALCEELEPSPETEAELAPLLRRYEMDLDRALLARNAMQDERRDLMSESGPGWNPGESRFDVQEVMRIAEKIREASAEVRDVNESYARQIRGVLTGETGERFDRLWRKWSYPKVYAETYTNRVLNAALEFEDLDAAQRERLDSLLDRYERELERANEAWARAIAESDAEGTSAVMIGGGGGGMMMIEEGDIEGGPIDEARRARRDLNRNYLAQVRGMLSPDQRTRLPAREMPQPPGGGTPGGQHFEFISVEMQEDDVDGGGGE